MMVQRWWRAVCHTHECAVVTYSRSLKAVSGVLLWKCERCLVICTHCTSCYVFYLFVWLFHLITILTIIMLILHVLAFMLACCFFFLLFYFLMHSVGSIKYHQSWTICFHLVVFMFNHMLMTDHMYAHCLKLTIDIENKDFLWQCIVIKMPSSNPVSQCMYMIFNMLILLNICQIHHLSSCCKDVKHS